MGSSGSVAVERARAGDSSSMIGYNPRRADIIGDVSTKRPNLKTMARKFPRGRRVMQGEGVGDGRHPNFKNPRNPRMGKRMQGEGLGNGQQPKFGKKKGMGITDILGSAKDSILNSLRDRPRLKADALSGVYNHHHRIMQDKSNRIRDHMRMNAHKGKNPIDFTPKKTAGVGPIHPVGGNPSNMSQINTPTSRSHRQKSNDIKDFKKQHHINNDMFNKHRIGRGNLDPGTGDGRHLYDNL